jgi:hypothetical protein
MGAAQLPFQRWRSFKEAFTPEIVACAVGEMKGRVKHIVDPFGGSGTTGLAAQFLGVRPTIIEVNPYLADLIEAKLARYEIDEVRDSYAWLIDRVCRTVSPDVEFFRGAPKSFVEPGVGGRYIFSRGTARRITAYRQAIEQLPNPNIQRLFRVILGCIVVPVSNVVISGKGRRYRRGWERRGTAQGTTDILFRQSAEMVIYDIHRFGARPCRDYAVLRGDSRQELASIDETELAVFSPPYPNSFDYTDVYNVELWSLGYLDSSKANLVLRNATLRSHVQIVRDLSGTSYTSKKLKSTFSRLHKAQDKLWNRHIPDMIMAYVSDMGDVLKAVGRKMRRGGRVYMVVGDSRYAGVHVPVAGILAEIAPELNYDVLRSEPFRSMRVSPQQGGQPGLLESLLVLRRR